MKDNKTVGNILLVIPTIGLLIILILSLIMEP